MSIRTTYKSSNDKVRILSKGLPNIYKQTDSYSLFYMEDQYKFPWDFFHLIRFKREAIHPILFKRYFENLKHPRLRDNQKIPPGFLLLAAYCQMANISLQEETGCPPYSEWP